MVFSHQQSSIVTCDWAQIARILSKSAGYKNLPEAFGETDDHSGVHDDKELWRKGDALSSR